MDSSQQRKHWLGMPAQITVPTCLMAIAEQKAVSSRLHAEAIIHEEPGAGKLHAGICAGAVG